MIKQCNKCNINKNISMFYKDKSKKCGIRHICKSCDNLAVEKWRVNNKDRYLARERKRDRSESSKKAKNITSQKHRNELSDMYIRSLMTKKSTILESKDIPNELVKAYRENLKLKRKLELTPKLKGEEGKP